MWEILIIEVEKGLKKFIQNCMSLLVQAICWCVFGVLALILVSTFNIIGVSGKEIDAYCAFGDVTTTKLTAEDEIKLAKCQAMIKRIAVEEGYNSSCTGINNEYIWVSVSNYWSSDPPNIYEGLMSADVLVRETLRKLYGKC
jgi:hypothetical protein